MDMLVRLDGPNIGDLIKPEMMGIHEYPPPYDDSILLKHDEMKYMGADQPVYPVTSLYEKHD